MTDRPPPSDPDAEVMIKVRLRGLRAAYLLAETEADEKPDDPDYRAEDAAAFIDDVSRAVIGFAGEGFVLFPEDEEDPK